MQGRDPMQGRGPMQGHLWQGRDPMQGHLWQGRDAMQGHPPVTSTYSVVHPHNVLKGGARLRLRLRLGGGVVGSVLMATRLRT